MSTYILQPIGPGPAVIPVDVDGTTGGGNFIRSVGTVTPSTSGWAVGDVWLDTLNSATANVPRVWTGTAFAPARSAAVPLLTELFTGSDGAVWNTSNWVSGLNPTAGTGGGATLLSNTGKLTSSNVGGFAGTSRISRTANITNPVDVNMSFSFKFDSTDAQPQVWIRANSALNGSAGYAFTFGKGIWRVGAYTGFSDTGLISDTVFGFAEGTWYSARFYVVGTAVKARVWLAADAEPTAWGGAVTDSTYTTANYVGFSNTCGTAAAATSVFIDNVTIEAS